VLLNLLLTETFLVEHYDIAWQAYHDYYEGDTDCLISRLNYAVGCSTTLTFDKRTSKLPHSTFLAKG